MSKYGAIEICDKYGLVINRGIDGMDTSYVKEEKKNQVICVDCGATRLVKPQDLFHVKRCVPCQKKYARTRKKVIGAAEAFRQ